MSEYCCCSSSYYYHHPYHHYHYHYHHHHHSLSSNQISSYGLTKLLNYLERNIRINEIDVVDNKIDDDIIHGLYNMMKINKGVKRIWLNKNNITDKGILLLNELINGNDYDVDNDDNNDNDVDHVGDSVGDNNNNSVNNITDGIRNINMNNNIIINNNNNINNKNKNKSNHHQQSFNTTLVELNLSQNKGITNKSIDSLIDILHATHIVWLNVERTSITQNKIIDGNTDNNNNNDRSSITQVSATTTSVPSSSTTTSSFSSLVDAIVMNQMKYGNELYLPRMNIDDDDLKRIIDMMIRYCIGKSNIITNNSGNGNNNNNNNNNSNNNTIRMLIERIHLRDNNLTDKGMNVIVDYIVNWNKHIKNINLSKNIKITKKSIGNVFKLMNQAKLEKMTLKHTELENGHRKLIKDIKDMMKGSDKINLPPEM